MTLKCCGADDLELVNRSVSLLLYALYLARSTERSGSNGKRNVLTECVAMEGLETAPVESGP